MEKKTTKKIKQKYLILWLSKCPFLKDKGKFAVLQFSTYFQRTVMQLLTQQQTETWKHEIVYLG